MNFLLKVITLYFNSLSWISPRLSAKQSFNLFAYPFSSKLRAEQQSFLETSEMFKINVDGKNVQGYTWGHGKEQILFVHGWQSNSYRWKSFVETFDKEKYTMHAFDAPGHGNSEGKVCTIPLYEKSIQALIEQKGPIDHFIGHSIGSFACASFMFHHNYSVQSYVSLASPFDAQEFVNDFTSKIRLSDRALAYLADYFKSYTTRPFEHYSQAVFSTAINAQKILIIHDKQDEATPYQNAHKTYNLLLEHKQNAELIITEGLRHRLRSAKVVALAEHCLAQQHEFES